MVVGFSKISWRTLLGQLSMCSMVCLRFVFYTVITQSSLSLSFSLSCVSYSAFYEYHYSLATKSIINVEEPNQPCAYGNFIQGHLNLWYLTFIMAHDLERRGIRPLKKCCFLYPCLNPPSVSLSTDGYVI